MGYVMDVEKPKKVLIEEELYICPQCGYKDGFHNSFVRQSDKICKIILICPSCHARFDVNWVVEI